MDVKDSPDRSQLIDIWQGSLQAIVDLAEGLDDRAWVQLTPCPGWTVGDLVAHTTDIEQMLAGDPRPQHEPEWDSLPHAMGDVGRFTEVGVDVIVPWAARNCVAQWRGERADRGLRKWTDAAQAAAKQACRARFPVVEPLASTADVVARLAEASVGLVLHETATAAIGSVATEGVRDFVLVVGPEGGIDPNELAAFSSAGAETVVLGPSVLRTSSAGMAGAAALLARTSRWDGRMAP